MRAFSVLVSLGVVLSEATPRDPGALVAAPLFFAAGVAHPVIAKGPVWFVCDSPRGIYPQIPDCEVPWREVTASE